MTRTAQQPSRNARAAAYAIGVLLGLVVAIASSDVVVGVIAGASFVVVAVGFLRLWTGDEHEHPSRHP